MKIKKLFTLALLGLSLAGVFCKPRFNGDTKKYLEDYCNSLNQEAYELKGVGSCEQNSDSNELCCFLKHPQMSVVAYTDFNGDGINEVFVQGQNDYYRGPMTNTNMIYGYNNGSFRKIFEHNGRWSGTCPNGKVDGYLSLCSGDKYDRIIQFDWNPGRGKYLPQ